MKSVFVAPFVKIHPFFPWRPVPWSDTMAPRLDATAGMSAVRFCFVGNPLLEGSNDAMLIVQDLTCSHPLNIVMTPPTASPSINPD